jgi:hypothetical protein
MHMKGWRVLLLYACLVREMAFFLGWAPVLQVDAVPHTVANRLATLTESTPHCGGLIPPLC